MSRSHRMRSLSCQKEVKFASNLCARGLFTLLVYVITVPDWSGGCRRSHRMTGRGSTVLHGVVRTQVDAQRPGGLRGALGAPEHEGEAREGLGNPVEAEMRGQTSFEQGSLALSVFPKSRQAGDSSEVVEAQGAHLRALGALGVHGGLLSIF